jgi:hypothetical protein
VEDYSTRKNQDSCQEARRAVNMNFYYSTQMVKSLADRVLMGCMDVEKCGMPHKCGATEVWDGAPPFGLLAGQITAIPGAMLADNSAIGKRRICQLKTATSRHRRQVLMT